MGHIRPVQTGGQCQPVTWTGRFPDQAGAAWAETSGSGPEICELPRTEQGPSASKSPWGARGRGGVLGRAVQPVQGWGLWAPQGLRLPPLKAPTGLLWKVLKM